jgi:hypothetical protein
MKIIIKKDELSLLTPIIPTMIISLKDDHQTFANMIVKVCPNS